MIEDILEQEALIIGSLLVSPERFDDCDLQPSDFSSYEHKQYFEAMLVCLVKNNLTAFSAREVFRAETGATMDCMLDYSGRGMHVGKTQFDIYVERIKKESHKNKALRIASQLIDNLNAGNVDSIGEAIGDFMSINKADEKYDHSFHEVSEYVVNAFERAQNGSTGAVKTGFSEMDKILGGWHPGDLVIIAARPAMGKDQPLYSKVLLDNGKFKAMGDLSIGDKLASVDGEESKVLSIHPQGLKKIYKLTLKDGRQVECGAEHLWKVKSSRFPCGEKTLTTIELKKVIEKARYKDRVQLVGHNGDFGYDDEVINPWVLGAMLGDGSISTGFGFTNSEIEMLDKMKSNLGDDYTLSKQSGAYDYNVKYTKGAGNPLKDEFKKLGLIGKKSYEKFIPDFAYTQSKEYRCELISGLIETDGWVERSGSIQFSSSSKRLSTDLKSLIESVGGSARYRLKTNVKYKYKGEIKNGLDAHILSISLPLHAQRFTTERITKNIKKRQISIEPSIVSINECGETETQCITVSHKSSLYITDNYCVTHNTAFMVNSFLRANTKVGVITAEQGSEQIGVRSVCIEGGVNHQNFRRAEMDDDEFARFKKGLAEFQLMNGRMFDKPAPTILDVEKVARQWVHKYGIGALYVDYAQRLGHENKRMNRIEQNSDIAKRLKELGRSLNIPVIALAQVNRACESRPDKRPHMGDIADASAYEKEADVIMTLYRDEVYNEDSQEKGIVEAILEKNRHGQTGTARLAWVGQYMQVNDFNGYEKSQDDQFYQADGYHKSSFAP